MKDNTVLGEDQRIPVLAAIEAVTKNAAYQYFEEDIKGTIKENKLADLVKYGSDYSFDEARRMLKTFDTVVYMENYQIQEILEVDGYDDETHQFNYINIYKNPTPRGM